MDPLDLQLGCTDANRNSCPTSYDNECDDGGPGAHYASCSLGTDCFDCGIRRSFVSSTQASALTTLYRQAGQVEPPGSTVTDGSVKRLNAYGWVSCAV
jgi:hypothetical protein